MKPPPLPLLLGWRPLLLVARSYILVTRALRLTFTTDLQYTDFMVLLAMPRRGRGLARSSSTGVSLRCRGCGDRTAGHGGGAEQKQFLGVFCFCFGGVLYQFYVSVVHMFDENVLT